MARRGNNYGLEACMALHRFMCGQFRRNSLRALLNLLDPVAAAGDGFLADHGGSRFNTVLRASLFDKHSHLSPRSVQQAELDAYDENIVAVSKRLGMAGARGTSWKPFQYLALLFTERYLHLYFDDAEGLAARLNDWLRYQESLPYDFPKYGGDDLHTLAFQSATGSGKTLLMHAHILQYRNYLRAHGLLHRLNKILLVTPDEGMSRQHLRELHAAGIAAQLFSDKSGLPQVARDDLLVDVIDIHKFAVKKGVKTVAVESFEDNNLVLVDEGHLGVGGNKWRNYRKQLAQGGFTFEYSATFNQAVSGGGDAVRELRDAYGKCLLFDYSYKHFYADGYGKDYHISNLPQSGDGEANDLYLTACLLAFYQQCKLYADKAAGWREYNLAPPLWVFLGRSVTGGVTPQSETDIIRIIKFLAWVQNAGAQVVDCIARLFAGTSGLHDENGREIFGDAYRYIKGGDARAVYDDIRARVFHGGDALRVEYLSGGELQLSAGDALPFAVVNIGDASGLYAKLDAIADKPFQLQKNKFRKALFGEVDRPHSPVNIVIGARKFAAGWNSWRVSTMGLMHVGAGEGPQIIQMFGRGVRLRGHGMSLKRHSALPDDAAPTDGESLKLLETLNVFGLKANYMEQFKKYLQTEGIATARATFTIRTVRQPPKAKGLKTLRKKVAVGEFAFSGELVELPGAHAAGDPVIMMDRRTHVQRETSVKMAGAAAAAANAVKLEGRHLAWMNLTRIYDAVLARKQLAGWHNLLISRAAVAELLANPEWYELHIAPEKLTATTFARVREWEELATELVCRYADAYWRRARGRWEHKHLEAAPLQQDTRNEVDGYELSVKVSPGEKENALLAKVREFVAAAERGEFSAELDEGEVQMSLLNPSFHAYVPLLHAETGGAVAVSPAALNRGEKNFVLLLSNVIERGDCDCLRDKDVYLMRNLSGKGVSFFADAGFYPDFILWVKSAARQDMLFIDPKGLSRHDSAAASKVALHSDIKTPQAKIQEEHPDLFLHAYIWSQTRADEIGADKPMSRDEFHSRGVYFADGWADELCKLLRHALR